MHPDIERLLAEDETARAGVDAARARTQAELDAIRADRAERRQMRLRALQQELDRTVADILAEGDREVERRRVQRAQHTREDAARAETLIDRGADLWVRIVRDGPPLGGGR